MSAHLGSRVSSFIDGQLDAVGTDRALVHLAGCPDCAREVQSARATRQALCRDLADVAPAPEFVDRLLALAGQVEAAPVAPESVRAAPTIVTTTDVSSFGEPLPPRWQALCGDLPSTVPALITLRRRRRSVAAALVVTGVAASGLFALGARPVVAPARHPAAALTALAGAVQPGPGALPVVVASSAGGAGIGSTEEGDGADGADRTVTYDHEVLDWMQAEGWPHPDALPEGLTVRSVQFTGSDGAVLEVDLESPIGDVVLREQRGQLAPDRLDELGRVNVGGAPVYVISADPLHLVWQSSDTVISLVSASSLDDVLQLVSTFSVDEFDTGFQARVERGWSTLTGVLS